MTVSDFDRPGAARFGVSVSRDGQVVQTREFVALELAEAFMEEWSEQHPHDQITIDDKSADHTAFELVEDDTAIQEDYDHEA